MKKTLFLLSTIIIFATAKLHAMDQQQQDPQQIAAPAVEKTEKQRLREAEIRYTEQKTKTDEEAQKLQNRVNSFSGYAEQAAARETVALGFRIIDRGLSTSFDTARKRLDWLSEEERLVKKSNELTLEEKKESLKHAINNNELTTSSTKTKDEERAYLKSQKNFQNLLTIEKLCSLTYDHKSNKQHPDCLKMLADFDKNFTNDLSTENETMATSPLSQELEAAA